MQRRHDARRYRGFTLVEIMVAVAIGMVILLGLTTLFARNSGNQAELERSTRQLESARYALDILSEDLVHAGYYGEFSPGDLTPVPTFTAPDPCSTNPATFGWTTPANPTLGLSVPAALTGYTDAAALGCTPNRRAATEAVAIRHMDTGEPIAIASIAADNLYVQASRCSTDIAQIIAGTSQTAAAFTLRDFACTGVTNEVRRYIPLLYYVASCNDCAANDGIPTLKRVQVVNGALRTVSLAEGVENLQIEYGVDRDNNGQPDAFLRAGSIGAAAPDMWENVVSVRLHLLTRNTETTAGYTDPRTYQLGAGVSVTPADAFKRTLMTTTIRLVNVGSRRE